MILLKKNKKKNIYQIKNDFLKYVYDCITLKYKNFKNIFYKSKLFKMIILDVWDEEGVRFVC